MTGIPAIMFKSNCIHNQIYNSKKQEYPCKKKIQAKECRKEFDSSWNFDI